MTNPYELDYQPGRGTYVVWADRAHQPDIRALMTDHGLDFSEPSSTPQRACLFTTSPYAVVAFAPYATARARAQLDPLLVEIASSRAPDYDGHYLTPPDQELWGFQKADLAYMLRRQHSLVGDEPGLGKTPIAITYCNEIRARRVLVLCPAAIRLQWARRIREWSTMRWPAVTHTIMTGSHGVHPTAQWTVASYDLARTAPIGRALAQGRYDVLILDEAHYLKTPDSLRTRALFGGGRDPKFPPIADSAEHVIALTGTPLPNRAREAFTLAKALDWGSIDWMGEDDFYGRYNPRVLIERPDPATGRTKRFAMERTGRAPELQARLRAHFMTRHLKRDVMPQLRRPVYDIVQVEETGAIKMALEAEKLLDIDPENLAGADAKILGHIAVVRKQMGVAMAPLVADYAKTVLDSGEPKLVIFAWHIEVLDRLQHALEAYRPLRIDGSTSPAQRDWRVQQFQDAPHHRVMIGNLLSMGVGVDGLQKVCSRGIIAEPSWTPSDNVQAFDRLDRGGQVRTVLGDILVAPGSIAERILAAALRKGANVHAALDKEGL